MNHSLLIGQTRNICPWHYLWPRVQECSTVLKTNSIPWATSPDDFQVAQKIHRVTTMLATSKNVPFPGHNRLLTTSTDDPSLQSLALRQQSKCLGGFAGEGRKWHCVITSTLHVVWCLIWWSTSSERVKLYTHLTSLVRPGIIKQHKAQL